MIYYVYVIENMITNKQYVGYTSNPSHRWKTHVKLALSTDDTRKILYRSMRRHGIDSFIFRLIYCSRHKDAAKQVEMETIDALNTIAPNGYNMTKGGDGGPGVAPEVASMLNKERVSRGKHVFQSKEFRDNVSVRMKEINPMRDPGVAARVSRALSITNAEKVARGEHYWQTEESKIEKRKRMAEMSSRPIVSEVRSLYKEAGLHTPRGNHSTSTEKLLKIRDELKEKIAVLQSA